MWYVFDQNNSGGGFDLRSESIIVEANSADEANALALTVGAYFDGMQDDEYVDCECCGDRWYSFDDEQTYNVYATLDDVLNNNKHHFSYYNDYAIVVPMDSDVYRISENPHTPRCKGTTKKGTQCGNGASDCKYH